MATPEAFAAACKQASRALRRLPAEVRRALGHRMKDEVAAPLAASIAAAWSGPYAAVLHAATKARVAADPQIVVGGAYPRLSGGAGPRDLEFGTEFGAGKRRSVTHAHTRTVRGRTYRVSAYSKPSTNQLGPAQHAIFGTTAEQLPAILEKVAEIITDTFDEVVPGG